MKSETYDSNIVLERSFERFIGLECTFSDFAVTVVTA